MKLNRRQTLAGISALSLTQFPACRTNDAPSGPSDLVKLDGMSQTAHIKSGHLSAREAMEAALARADHLNPELNAFTDINADLALSKASGPLPETALQGLPYALKDLNEYPGMKFEMGSEMFRGQVGKSKTPYTEKIDDSGVVVFGKTATPEFGLLGTTEPLAFKPCRNPWNLEHSTGGSSGGAAAIVAARILPMAQASDGGGSIRNPAAHCGIVGLKPTRGRFPAQGNAKREIEISIKHAVSLSVRDSAMMLALTEAENGAHAPVGFVTPTKLESKRIAVTTQDLLGREPHPAIKSAVENCAKTLENMGHTIEFVEKGPGLRDDLFDDFIVLWGQSVVPITDAAAQMSGKTARGSGLLEDWTLELSERFLALDAQVVDQSMKRLIDGGEKLNGWLGGYDAWLTPAASMPAPKLGWTRGDLPFEQNLERSAQLVAHFGIHNVAGTPGISLPWGYSEGLPLGIQLSAQRAGERILLELAYQLEEARPWMNDLPPVHAK